MQRQFLVPVSNTLRIKCILFICSNFIAFRTELLEKESLFVPRCFFTNALQRDKMMYQQIHNRPETGNSSNYLHPVTSRRTNEARKKICLVVHSKNRSQKCQKSNTTMYRQISIGWELTKQRLNI